MELFKRWKWALIAAASILIAVGLIAIIVPSTVMHILPIFLGITLLIVGIFEIAYSIGIKEYTSIGPFKLIQGGVSIAVGLVFIIKQSVSLAFLGIVLGLWALISAGLKFALALRQHKAQCPYIGIVVDAVLRACVGLFMMFNPFGSLAAWTLLAGILFVSAGLGLLVWTIYISRHIRAFNFFDIK
ncbi:MAG: DUF308 domain-containing protein [Oscillospiraceae bacterium]